MLFRLLGGHLLFSWGYLPCASKHELKSNEDVLHGKSWQRALISAEGFLRHQLNNPCDDQFEDYKACILEELAARGVRLPGQSLLLGFLPALRLFCFDAQVCLVWLSCEITY
ncbi:unnamed protein product [Durusdinium trenchii]|uniref:Uncharacterized protein n=1 Tax=Durusdinium trenchii TaxID=1381693 RepID=A0ABP0M9M9_9DINO